MFFLYFISALYWKQTFSKQTKKQKRLFKSFNRNTFPLTRVILNILAYSYFLFSTWIPCANCLIYIVFCWHTVSVQFSCSVLSDSLRPHESQHTRPPCPSPSPGVHSDSHPSSPWCHPAISSSVVPFFSCPPSLLASESFPMSQLFVWGSQSIGVSALASGLPMNTQDWSPLGWTGWTSLQST